MADQIDINRLRAFDSDGNPAAGAKATFFEAGTSTPVTVYADDGLLTPHPSPLVADSAGVFAPIYFGVATGVKAVVTDAADAALYTLDPARRATAAGSSASAIAFAPTSSIVSENVQEALVEVDAKISAGSPVVDKASGYTVAASDFGRTIRCTTGLTLGVTAADTLGDGFTFHVFADGGDVVVDAAGSETINGAETLTVVDGQNVRFVCNGSAFFAAVWIVASEDADLSNDPSAALRRDIARTQFGAANAPGTKTALNASGTAPIYACRAWVSFGGVSGITINGSGNIASVVRNGVGDYTVTFATALEDANYSVQGNVSLPGNNDCILNLGGTSNTPSITASSFKVYTLAGTSLRDADNVHLAIFR